jgi:hypothetical protein
MILRLASLASLLALAGVWLTTELSPQALPLGSLVSALIPLAALLFVVALACRSKEPAAAKCLALSSALGLAESARLGWLPQPTVSPYILWGAAFAVAVVTGWLFRKVPEGELLVVPATGDSAGAARQPKMGVFAWLVFTAVAAFSGFLLLYRVTDQPAELNSYGTQSLSAAARLLRGEVLLKDLILFREMTQEECGHSLPYVLWHALFQLACGGLSVFAARLACGTASWLSVLVMFRVGKRLGGVPFGLSAMVSYAVMPLTIWDARSELFLSFSALLVLFFIDAMLAYLRRPTLIRALWMGLAFIFTFYGIANIKILVAASGLMFAWTWLRNSELRRNSWQLAASAALVALLALPQILEWQKVSHQMRGRGEHLFGGVLPHLTIEDPRKPTQIQKALWILEENSKILVETTFGPYSETFTSLPSTLYVPLIVAFGLAVGNLLRPDRMLLTGLLAASYFGPAIAIPLGWVRLLMINSAQALVIGSLWAAIFSLLRSMRIRGAAVITALIAVSALVSVVEPLKGFLSQNHKLALSRSFALQEQPGTLIFFTDKLETSGNMMRWNPPKLGRDSLAERPVVVIRETSIGAAKMIVEQLNVPAIIMSNEPPPAEFAGTTNWTTSQEPGQMWVMRHSGGDLSRPAVVTAVDPRILDSSSPVFMERVYYQTYRLVLTPIQQEPISVKFSLAKPLSKAFIIARGRDSFTAPVDMSIDNGALQLTPHASQADGKSTTWFESGALASGDHTLTLTLRPDAPEPQRYVDDVTIIGVAR